jgi:SAM-dependent methyltransferase
MSVYATAHTPLLLASHANRKAETNIPFMFPHLTNLLSTVPAPKILDVGCGPGSITISLARLVPTSHITGIEVVEAPLIEARKIASAEGVTSVDFKVGDGHDLRGLGMADEEFDVVFCHQVLQHARDPVAMLREMRRVCKKGGFVAVKESAENYWYPATDGILASWKLFQDVARAKGGNPAPGARLHVWAKEAGFDSAKSVSSSSSMTFRTRKEREGFGKGVLERIRAGGEWEKFAVQKGVANVEELDAMSNSVWQWIEDDDKGWLAILAGEFVGFV